MAGSCKSCFSSHREVIDERLKKGESIEKLSEWLKGQGEMISPPSLLRHRKNHIPAMALENNVAGRFITDNRNAPRNDSEDGLNESFIDTAEVLERLSKETENINVFTSVLEARKFTQLLMERIVQNQLVIVHELQQQYTAGKSGYPDSQIRGLKTILDITNALPTYAAKGVVYDMKRATIEGYVEPIRQHALDLGKKNHDKYKPDWSFVTSSEVFEPPEVLIQECAKKLHPSNEDSREEWEDDMYEYWRKVFTDSMFWQWRYEEQVRDIINDNWIDDDTEEYTLVLNAILEGVMTRYECPFDAAQEQSGLDEFVVEIINNYETVEEV